MFDVELQLRLIIADIVVGDRCRRVEHAEPNAEAEQVAESALDLCVGGLAVGNSLEPSERNNNNNNPPRLLFSDTRQNQSCAVLRGE